MLLADIVCERVCVTEGERDGACEVVVDCVKVWVMELVCAALVVCVSEPDCVTLEVWAWLDESVQVELPVDTCVPETMREEDCVEVATDEAVADCEGPRLPVDDWVELGVHERDWVIVAVAR